MTPGDQPLRAVIRIIEEVLVREIETLDADTYATTTADINIDAVMRAIERELSRRQLRIVWGTPQELQTGAPLVGGLA
jgi:hypothetical protein